MFVNYFFKKNMFLSNYSGEDHQKFLGEKTIPLSGGLLNSGSVSCVEMFRREYKVCSVQYTVYRASH